MKEHPIIFSTDMVKAILAGRKTMTRRIIKPQPPFNFRHIAMAYLGAKNIPKCPYQTGNILWVRETFGIYKSGEYSYKADKDGVTIIGNPWKPSIHMPRKAARIFLEITDVSVERLNDITYQDAVNEGVEVAYKSGDEPALFKKPCTGIPTTHPEGSFECLWNSIHGKGAWSLNPWVWVVAFKRIQI